MNAVLDILDGYQSQDAAEAHDVEMIRGVAARGDPFRRQNKLHITGSALVVHVDSLRVLLRWHDRIERWIQVGGHGEAGESDPYEVALREASEETGLADLRPLGDSAKSALVQVVIVPVPAHGDEPDHEHADFRYLLATGRPDQTMPESNASALRWLPIESAVAEAEEKNLHEFLVRVQQILDSERQSWQSHAVGGRQLHSRLRS